MTVLHGTILTLCLQYLFDACVLPSAACCYTILCYYYCYSLLHYTVLFVPYFINLYHTKRCSSMQNKTMLNHAKLY